MKEKNIWLLKIINPSTDYTLTIYENGLVYGKEYNEKLEQFYQTVNRVTYLHIWRK